MEKRFVIIMLMPLLETPGVKPYATIRVSKRAYKTYEQAEKALLLSKHTITGKPYSIMAVYVKTK